MSPSADAVTIVVPGMSGAFGFLEINPSENPLAAKSVATDGAELSRRPARPELKLHSCSPAFEIPGPYPTMKMLEGSGMSDEVGASEGSSELLTVECGPTNEPGNKTWISGS